MLRCPWLEGEPLDGLTGGFCVPLEGLHQTPQPHVRVGSCVSSRLEAGSHGHTDTCDRARFSMQNLCKAFLSLLFPSFPM